MSWKTLGRIVSAPVRLPVRLVNKGIEKGQQKIMNAIVLMCLRNGLKLVGMAGLFSNSDVEQAAGALGVLIGLGMSAFKAWTDHKATQITVTTPPAA